MTIAANYRRFPSAMAVQLPLPFGRALVWATSRPGSRILRAIRYARARLVAAHPRTVHPVAPTVPAWCKAARKAARDLARSLADLQQALCEYAETEQAQPEASGASWQPRIYQLVRRRNIEGTWQIIAGPYHTIYDNDDGSEDVDPEPQWVVRLTTDAKVRRQLPESELKPLH